MNTSTALVVSSASPRHAGVAMQPIASQLQPATCALVPLAARAAPVQTQLDRICNALIKTAAAYRVLKKVPDAVNTTTSLVGGLSNMATLNPLYVTVGVVQTVSAMIGMHKIRAELSNFPLDDAYTCIDEIQRGAELLQEMNSASAAYISHLRNGLQSVDTQVTSVRNLMRQMMAAADAARRHITEQEAAAMQACENAVSCMTAARQQFASAAQHGKNVTRAVKHAVQNCKHILQLASTAPSDDADDLAQRLEETGAQANVMLQAFTQCTQEMQAMAAAEMTGQHLLMQGMVHFQTGFGILGSALVAAHATIGQLAQGAASADSRLGQVTHTVASLQLGAAATQRRLQTSQRLTQILLYNANALSQQLGGTVNWVCVPASYPGVIATRAVCAAFGMSSGVSVVLLGSFVGVGIAEAGRRMLLSREQPLCDIGIEAYRDATVTVSFHFNALSSGLWGWLNGRQSYTVGRLDICIGDETLQAPVNFAADMCALKLKDVQDIAAFLQRKVTAKQLSQAQFKSICAALTQTPIDRGPANGRAKGFVSEDLLEMPETLQNNASAQRIE